MSKRTKNTKRLKQANKRRKYTYDRNNSKPPPDAAHKTAARKCLMCNITFQSNHVGHRVCSDCKTTSAWIQPHMGL